MLMCKTKCLMFVKMIHIWRYNNKATKVCSLLSINEYTYSIIVI